MMNQSNHKTNLIDNYLHDTLSRESLAELRELLASDREPELLDMIEEYDLEKGLPEDADIDESTIEHLRGKCMAAAGLVAVPRITRRLRVAVAAAAVLIPALIVITVLLWHNNRDYRQIVAQGVSFLTGNNERATASLPDGSTVELNSLSKLTYAPLDFNKKSREVDFDGEGYFSITANPEAPFTIHSAGVEVTVHGTVFNLCVREANNVASLYLEEGSVTLSTESQEVSLTTGQLATVCRSSGMIDVSDVDSPHQQALWRKSMMYFDEIPLVEVLDSLSARYDCAIVLAPGIDCSESTFTGYLQSDNMNDALSILEYTFHLHSHRTSKGIILSE